jgi:hypothetical protein
MPTKEKQQLKTVVAALSKQKFPALEKISQKIRSKKQPK